MDIKILVTVFSFLLTILVGLIAYLWKQKDASLDKFTKKLDELLDLNHKLSLDFSNLRNQLETLSHQSRKQDDISSKLYEKVHTLEKDILELKLKNNK